MKGTISIKNYKCYDSEGIELDASKSVNLIIGRNNSGKSVILDALGVLFSPRGNDDREKLKDNGNHNLRAELSLSCDVSEEDVRAAFPRVQSSEFKHAYGRIGERLEYYIIGDKDVPQIRVNPLVQPYNKKITPLIQVVDNRFRTRCFSRLLPERDISPNKESDGLTLSSNGEGITNIIRAFIVEEKLDEDLVESVIKDGLNQIFGPEDVFDRIGIVKKPNRDFEFYLKSPKKGKRLTLSNWGSGLKTVVLVLCHLHLLPVLRNKPVSEFVFAFEELENNIHPQLLRKLIRYVIEFSLREGCIVYLVTHSNVLIDMISTVEDSQVIHVKQKHGHSFVEVLNSNLQKRNILDDLDVRASDLMQANSIIWVEGPSDRVFVKKWIEIWSGGLFVEGVHYQCMFTGGTILSHFSAESEDLSSAEVEILRVNRNAIILIDSDKDSEDSPLKATAVRIKDEFEKIKCLCWITSGREVENYIPQRLLMDILREGNSAEDKFLRVPHSTKVKKPKVVLARSVVDLLTLEDLKTTLDLGHMLNEVCLAIGSHNGVDFEEVPI